VSDDEPDYLKENQLLGCERRDCDNYIEHVPEVSGTRFAGVKCPCGRYMTVNLDERPTTDDGRVLVPTLEPRVPRRRGRLRRAVDRLGVAVPSPTTETERTPIRAD
jgi:hypothetical protein